MLFYNHRKRGNRAQIKNLPPLKHLYFSRRMAKFSIFKMSLNMSVACTSITEPLPTGKTAVRLFSCMDPNMHAKMTRLPEVFITVGTVIWSLSWMNSEVNFQQSSRAETPPAHHTQISFRFTLVNCRWFVDRMNVPLIHAPCAYA